MTLQSAPRFKTACLAACALALAGWVALMQVPPSSNWVGVGTSMLTGHLLLELFAIVIAAQIVTVSWHTFDAQRSQAANVLIIGFSVVASCDLVHALTYDGMPPFLGPSGTPRAIFFWLMGRSVEVLTLGVVAVGWHPRISRKSSLLAGGVAAALLIWMGSYHLDAFPQTFVRGQGVTPFKALCEYLLFAGNLAVAALLWRKAGRSGEVRDMLLATSCFIIGVGELSFTSYTAPSDFQNVFGHVYKVMAYALLYWATFITSLRAPFEAVRESEARVRESELRLRSLSNNLPNCVVYQVLRERDGTMRFLHVSDAVERVNGLRAADILHDPQLLYGQIHPEDAALLAAAEQRSAHTLQVFDAVVRLRRSDGQLRWMHLYSAPRQLDGGRVVWDGVQLDITDRKLAEEERLSLEAQLRESQKMESVGRLAGGIAHDFNNILGSILGNLALMREDLRSGATNAAQQMLEQINQASLRARALVQQILTFSRRQTQQLVRQPLRPLVEESLALLRATLPAGVTLESRLGDFAEEVHADATQVGQVVMNLCTNAWQALDGRPGGYIGVGLERVHLDAAAAQALGGLPDGDYAHLWVSDNGCGMDEATRSRIFEPFYTTKPVGQGTGLGLSVVHGIVKAHNGAIAVRSTPGKGSTFDVYFPALAPQLAQHPKHTAGALRRRGRGEKVLYIDDDEIMLMMVERLLEAEGYAVQACCDSSVALNLLLNTGAHFDVVVTDYNMPLKSGLDIARELGLAQPDLPVVVSSGYITEELRAEAQRLGVKALLQKQNTFEELGGLIQEVLAAQRAARPTPVP